MTDIAHRIQTATGATDVFVEDPSTSYAQWYVQLSSKTDVRTLREQLTAAGFEVIRIDKDCEDRYIYLNDKQPADIPTPQPPAATPKDDEHDGICNRCGKPIPFGHEQMYNPTTGEHYHAYCRPLPQPGDGLPPSEPPDVGTWDDVAAMAADPDIQRELRAINADFEHTLMDGLDDEDMTWEAAIDALPPDAITDMPSVWASEHDAVVAERDAAQAEVTRLRAVLQEFAALDTTRPALEALELAKKAQPHGFAMGRTGMMWAVAKKAQEALERDGE